MVTRTLTILLLAAILAGGCHKAPVTRWYGCAPAAAARLLAYWGVNTTAQQLAVAMSTDTLTGSTSSESIAVGIMAVAPDLRAALTWNDSTALKGTGLLCMVGRDHVVTFGLPGDVLPCLDSLRAFAVVGVVGTRGGEVMALGVVKEVHDKRWDWGDIVADVVGIGAGGGLAWLIGALL